MKHQVNWKWVHDNWVVLLAIPWFAIFGLLFIFGVFEQNDPELRDRSSRVQLAAKLEDEMRSLALPENSSLISVENPSKYKDSIYIFGEYRTQISSDLFLQRLDQDLTELGWIFYGKVNERGSFFTFKYCRGKFDADLSYQVPMTLWPPDYDTWKLSFTSENRHPFFGSPNVPEKCINAN